MLFMASTVVVVSFFIDYTYQNDIKDPTADTNKNKQLYKQSTSRITQSSEIDPELDLSSSFRSNNNKVSTNTSHIPKDNTPNTVVKDISSTKSTIQESSVTPFASGKYPLLTYSLSNTSQPDFSTSNIQKVTLSPDSSNKTSQINLSKHSLNKTSPSSPSSASILKEEETYKKRHKVISKKMIKGGLDLEDLKGLNMIGQKPRYMGEKQWAFV